MLIFILTEVFCSAADKGELSIIPGKLISDEALAICAKVRDGRILPVSSISLHVSVKSSICRYGTRSIY
jgi:hypothetical protein